MKTNMALATAALFAAWCSGTTPAATPAHLYVGIGGCTGGGPVLRYPLVAGKPAPQPDLTYTAASAPIAIAADGSLFAEGPVGGTVDVFPPNSTTASRELRLTPSAGYRGVQINDLAVDSQGFLYVSFAQFTCSKCMTGRTRTRGVVPAYNLPATGVAIFPPMASGHARPVVVIPLSQGGGVAVRDTTPGFHELYASLPSSIVVYDNPTQLPTLVRTISGRSIVQPQGLAFDPAGSTLYVYNTPFLKATVTTYRANANGSVRPLRAVPLGKGSYFMPCSRAAVDAGTFFAPGQLGDVLEFRTSGSIQPIDQLQTHGAASSLALGP